MKVISHHLGSIDGIGIYPLVSLCIFFLFFAGLLIYVFRMTKEYLGKMENMPMGDNEKLPGDGVRNRLSGTSGSLMIFLVMLTCMPFSASAAEVQAPAAVNDTLVFSLLVFSALILLMIIWAQVSAMKSILENQDIWTKHNRNYEKITKNGSSLIIFMAATGTTVSLPLITMTKELYWLLIGLNAFLLGIIITLHFVFRGIVRALSGEKGIPAAESHSTLKDVLTKSVPVEREKEIMLDHNYDGIRELDNSLPPWWVYSFYITILFAVIYLIRFHVTMSAPLQMQEYEKELAEAEAVKAEYASKQANQIDEANLEALKDGARLASGKKVFVDNCQICHGAGGEGLVGPNLTDRFWKICGVFKNLFYTIKTGVPDKGMISWANQLTPSQIHEVASYIIELEGSNPPNQKAPEGVEWMGENATPVIPTADSSTAENNVHQEAGT